jgi:glutamate/tyrosine decarboxylase-like PLP-dependent enzyme
MDEKRILSAAFEKIRNYLQENKKQSNAVAKFKSPEQLNEIIQFGIDEKAVTENEFLELLDKYLEYSVKTANKQFLNQLFSGFNFPAFIGEAFATLANTSMYTYEVAPVATNIETEMIRLMCSYTGYAHGDGIFVSGGSNANLIAMFSARNHLFPEIKSEGVDKELKLTAFINKDAHYSIDNAANLLGIGVKNVIKVNTDNTGRIIESEFEKEIIDSKARGETPFFAVATCATTLTGAFDPIEEMHEICKRHNVWLHADGAFGGSVLLSDEHKGMMKGVENTDSFSWNPHKLMNIPLICSAILLKDKNSLIDNFTDLDADYLFHNVDNTDDLGRKSIQCGRRVDAVKLWFAWKYYGLEGYSKRINNLVEMAKHAEAIVNNHPKLQLLVPRNSFTICFRYIPDSNTDINQFNLQLRQNLRDTGKSMVNYGFIEDTLVLRLVAINADLDKSDIELFFRYVSEEGDKLNNASQ